MSSKDTHDERDLGYDGLNRRNILLAGSTLAAASALSSSLSFDSQDGALHLLLASSRPATGLSAPAPAQRAGAQRLCALALSRPPAMSAQRTLRGALLTLCFCVFSIAAHAEVDLKRFLANYDGADIAEKQHLAERLLDMQYGMAWTNAAIEAETGTHFYWPSQTSPLTGE